jgi:hypothetical protein
LEERKTGNRIETGASAHFARGEDARDTTFSYPVNPVPEDRLNRTAIVTSEELINRVKKNTKFGISTSGQNVC